MVPFPALFPLYNSPLLAPFLTLFSNELAQVCFRSRSGPWYTRRGATVFVLILLAGVNLLLQGADHLVFKVSGVGPFLSSTAAAYALIATELIWVALLE